MLKFKLIDFILLEIYLQIVISVPFSPLPNSKLPNSFALCENEDKKTNIFHPFSGKLWLNEPDMTWKQEMPPVPSSEESKIALQSRLGLSPPGKYSKSQFIV